MVRAAMEVNFFGVVVTTRAALPHLRAARGRVITVIRWRRRGRPAIQRGVLDVPTLLTAAGPYSPALEAYIARTRDSFCNAQPPPRPPPRSSTP